MQIAITVFGQNRQTDVIELSKIIYDSECNIIECRIARHSSIFAGYLIVEGQWNQIAKIERNLATHLPSMAVSIHRFEQRKTSDNFLPYTVDVVGAESVGMIHKLILFFQNHKIHLQEISSSSFTPNQSSSKLFSAHFMLGIPPDSRIISLRDEFFEYCDQLSLDAIFEPIKR